MVITLELPGIGDTNQVQISYEFFNVETSQARPVASSAPSRWTRAPRARRARVQMCNGPTVDVFPSQ